jgi:uncharacterized membrane protein
MMATLMKVDFVGEGMSILVIKWIHILSAVLMFGAGVGSAFSLYRVNRVGNLQCLMAEKLL